MYYVATDWAEESGYTFGALEGARTLAEAQVMAQRRSVDHQIERYGKADWSKVYCLVLIKGRTDKYGTTRGKVMPLRYSPVDQYWETRQDMDESIVF